MRTFLLASLLAIGCGSPAKQTPKWDAAGSYGVGVHTFTFVDSTRATPANGSYAGAADRTLVTEVWYPATTAASPGEESSRDATAASGSFALVVHSHGFMDNRNGENYLARRLASHGFIVAAPDYPLSNGAAPGGPTVLDTPNQPGDLSFVIDSLLADSTYGPLIDAAHIGASGLSLGGLTTLLATYHPRLRDQRITAAFTMAAVSCMFTAPFFAQSVPLLLLQGDADLIAPPEDNSERSFPLAQAPKELALLKAGSHTAFAGVASILDPSMNYDRLGCSEIGSVSVTGFGALGSEADGISQDPSVCPAPCTGTPIDPSLSADRQQELTQVIGLAFFDNWLRGNSAGKKYLEGALASENPEVTVRLK